MEPKNYLASLSAGFVIMIGPFFPLSLYLEFGIGSIDNELLALLRPLLLPLLLYVAMDILLTSGSMHFT